MPQYDKADTERRMNGAVESLKGDLGGLRTGRANTSLLDPVVVEVYGSMMPLASVATVNAPEPRMLSVQVWDKSNVNAVEKGITKANLGLNPMMDRLDERLRGFVNWRAIKAKTDRIADTVELPESYRPKLVSQLSGGNQQKVLFGKAFGQDIDLYIFDEPTVGVDMGTRAALYLLIKDLAEAGKAVVLISSDLPEVLNLSHRMLVFAHGTITAELSGDDMTEDRVLTYFFDETGATA